MLETTDTELYIYALSTPFVLVIAIRRSYVLVSFSLERYVDKE